MKKSKHISIIFICFGFVLIAFPAICKPCTPDDFINYMSQPQDNMVYRTSPGAKYPTNIAISYDMNNNTWLGRYAQPNSVRPQRLVQKFIKNNSIYLKPSDSNSNISYVKFEFKNITEHTKSHWNDSCQSILAEVIFKKNKLKRLYLVEDTENSPQQENYLKTNEKAAVNIKKIFFTNAKYKLLDIFSYPARLCTSSSNIIILNSRKDVLKNYHHIVTKYEKKYLKRSIPYNLRTTGPWSNFAQDSILIKNGLIKSICIQGDLNTIIPRVCSECR